MKALTILIMLFVPLQGFSQSQGPNDPTAATSVTSGNGKPWVNPTNVFSSENTYTSVILNFYPNNTSTTNCYATAGLAATGFGFSIPGTDNIDGIVVEIEKKIAGGLANQVYDSTIMMMKNAVPIGANKSSATGWSAAGDAITTYGSSSDLWGTTWTAADINDVNFGLFLIARNTFTNNAPQVSIDHISITVYHSAPTPTGIHHNVKDQEFSVYPNPGSANFTVHMHGTINSITVRNMLGETVYTNANTGQQTELDLSNHPKGIYFLQVFDENKNSLIKQIIIQ